MGIQAVAVRPGQLSCGARPSMADGGSREAAAAAAGAARMDVTSPFRPRGHRHLHDTQFRRRRCRVTTTTTCDHQATEALLQEAKSGGLGVSAVDTEYCFNVEVSGE